MYLLRDLYSPGEGYSFSVFAPQSRAPLISSGTQKPAESSKASPQNVYDFLNY